MGGFLGVDIFFVLSAYLVTSKILKAQEEESDFNLHEFWISRVRRLLPSAYVMIAVSVVWVILFNSSVLTTILEDAASSVFYATNWWYIFHKLSYFDSFGTPSPLKHLWFIAVQEQFLFIWPVILLARRKYIKNRLNLSILVFILALSSCLLMGIMYNPEADPSRIYYGTDTRSFELLIGALLGILMPINKIYCEQISTKKRFVINVTGAITLAVFIICSIFVDEYHPFLFRGGLFLFSLNTTLLIACICHPSCFISYIFSSKPLRWIGARAYGIYLWHYPVMALSTPTYEIGNPSYLRVGLQLTVTFILAELSYSFIETPVRKLGLKKFCKQYMSINIFKWERLNMAKRISAIAVLLLIAVLSVGIAGIDKNEKKIDNTEAYIKDLLLNSTEQAAVSNETSTGSQVKDETNSGDTDKVVPTEETAASSGEKEQVNPTEKVPESSTIKDQAISTEKPVVSSEKKEEAKTTEGSQPNSAPVIKSSNQILAVGDSIMLNIAPNLKQKYAGITVDGKVSRQMADAIKLAPGYSEFNSTGKSVVVVLGTNGFFTDKQIDSFLDSFSKANIYLVNTRVPRSWEKRVNEVLKKKAEDRDNVELIDWYSTAINHPEYFGSDGVHLKAIGAEALVNLISKALNSK